MSHNPVLLISLPNELLERIASYCSCSTALSLASSCRTIYETLNNKHVFIQIIQNGNGTTRHHEPWQPPEGRAASLKAWQKWCLADEKAWAFIDADESRRLDKWAPMLMVADHPLTSSDRALHIYKLIKSNSNNPALSFCLAAQVNNDLENGNLTKQMTSEIVSRSIFRSSDTLEGALIRILNERNQRFRDPELRYPIVYQGLAMFSYLLRKAIHEGKVRYRRPIPTVPNVLHPPKTSQIPFASFMKLQLPFAPTFWSAFVITKQFLESSEWVGYYSYNTGPLPVFDAPMRGIRFTAQERQDTLGSSFYQVSAFSGLDNNGLFDVAGIVHVAGDVRMVKTYRNLNTSWNWNALVTPFGIVGTWGDDRDLSDRWRGWFWLWKMDWMQ